MTARRPGPPWPLALVIMLVGVALAVPLVVRSVTSVAGAVSGPVHDLPASFEEDLDPGRYVVFERTGTTRRTGGLSATRNAAPTLTPSDVVVTGPDGEEVETTVDRADETITRGSATFTGVVVFDVVTGGTHEIEISGDGQEVLVAPSLGRTFRSLGGPFVLALGGGLVFLLGLVLLAVGIVRRSRQRPEATAPAGGVVAGWYPDPGGSGGRRYWDGAQWTEHTSA